jgi:ligand-binding sensor domain-containing protein
MKTISAQFLAGLVILAISASSVNAQWTLTRKPGAYVRAIDVNNDTLFVATGGGAWNGGILCSYDGGNSWDTSKAHHGAVSLTKIPAELFIRKGNTLFAFDLLGDYHYTTDDGNVWLDGDYVSGSSGTYLVTDSNVFIGSDSRGVFKSYGGYGGVLESADTGLTNRAIRSLTMFGTTILAGTLGGVFRSTDNCKNWTAASAGLTDTYIKSLWTTNSALFARTSTKGVFRSVDTGSTWTAVDSSLPKTANSFQNINNALIAGTDSSGLFRSVDNGVKWTAVNSGPPGSFKVYMFLTIKNNVFAGTGIGVMRSGDNGLTWTTVNSGLSSTNISCLSADSSGTLYAGVGRNSAEEGALFRSTDNGTSWTQVDMNLSRNYSSVTSLAVCGANVWAGTNDGAFCSKKRGASWLPVIDGLDRKPIAALAVSGTTVFAANGLIYHSQIGSPWWSKDTAKGGVASNSLAASGTYIIGGTSTGVSASTNFGLKWTFVNFGLTVQSLAIVGSTIFAGTAGGGVLRSTDYGASFFAFNSGLPSSSTVLSLAANGKSLFAGTEKNGVYVSPDNGATWNAANNGLTGKTIYSLAIANDTVFAGTDSGEVFMSAGNGSSWMPVGVGLPKFQVRSLAVMDSNLFAGTYGGWIWRRPLSGMVGVIDYRMQAAFSQKATFKILSLAYTNPNVTIAFSLPHPERVALDICNLSGQEIVSLVNTELKSGSHKFSFDTRKIATGCYTVRMQTGSSSYVKSILISR